MVEKNNPMSQNEHCIYGYQKRIEALENDVKLLKGALQEHERHFHGQKVEE